MVSTLRRKTGRWAEKWEMCKVRGANYQETPRGVVWTLISKGLLMSPGRTSLRIGCLTKRTKAMLIVLYRGPPVEKLIRSWIPRSSYLSCQGRKKAGRNTSRALEPAWLSTDSRAFWLISSGSVVRPPKPTHPRHLRNRGGWSPEVNRSSISMM